MLLSVTDTLHCGGDLAPASAWVQRWSHLARPGGRVLDIACGQGRHMAWFARRGLQVTGIDRSAEALALAGRYGQVVQADLETQGWPVLDKGRPQRFDVVVVTNYLWRPLFPSILDSLVPGGLLLYETFAMGNARFGRPSRPEFLLRPGELLQHCRDLQIVAYEHGLLAQPARCVQRIAAVAPGASAEAPWEPLWLE